MLNVENANVKMRRVENEEYTERRGWVYCFRVFLFRIISLPVWRHIRVSTSNSVFRLHHSRRTTEVKKGKKSSLISLLFRTWIMVCTVCCCFYSFSFFGRVIVYSCRILLRASLGTVIMITYLATYPWYIVMLYLQQITRLTRKLTKTLLLMNAHKTFLQS